MLNCNVPHNVTMRLAIKILVALRESEMRTPGTPQVATGVDEQFTSAPLNYVDSRLVTMGRCP
jgi:hypothetical protein